MKKLLFNSILVLFILFSSNQAFGAIVSYDNVFNANDVYATNFHTQLNENFDKVANGTNNIVTGQITDDTLTEADMSDEINPRIRTYEGANCEFVVTGLTIVSGGSLTQNIAAGTAYPRGFRINKASATAKTFTASKWTFVDLDQNGDFQYSEVAISGATPSVATNSLRLARVSTDSSTVATVSDLRVTSCFIGSFGSLRNLSTEPNLSDMFSYGKPLKEDSAQGFINGAIVSFDKQNTFFVRSGSAFISNNIFRVTSSDIQVPQTTATPASGISGLDTGAIANSTRYYVYLNADQTGVATYSVIFSTNATTPTGATNYRRIGEILTDGSSRFTSADILTYHAISKKEMIGAWVTFAGATGVVADAFNVSSASNTVVGRNTITIDVDFANANYAVTCTGGDSGGAADNICMLASRAAGTTGLKFINSGGADNDGNLVSYIAIGRR